VKVCVYVCLCLCVRVCMCTRVCVAGLNVLWNVVCISFDSSDKGTNV